MLLTAGALTDASNDSGQTPLHRALEADAPLHLVETIVDRGRVTNVARIVSGDTAPLHKTDDAGLAPVHVAARHSTDPRVLAFLEEKTSDHALCAETESGTNVLALLDGNAALPKDLTYNAIHDRCPELDPRTAE